VTPAIFFSLLIIAVAFLPVFGLTGQAGRLFKPLAYTKTFVMLAAALLSITFAPALRDFLIRGRIFPEHRHPVSRFLIRLYRPVVYVALRRPVSTIAIGLFAVISAASLTRKLGHEFMPPLNEGDILYMPITLPNISIEEAKRQLQIQDRVLKSFPEVESVFGKVGRAETPTDPAPLTMVETTVRLKPQDQWRRVLEPRWYSSWAPDLVKTALRPIWPEERAKTWDELTAEMNDKMRLPGWTNPWTMPIKTRVDMLTTGIRTPIGVKVFGSDLDVIEKVGVSLERLMSAIPGTRSVLYERNSGGLYLDIIPNRDALARYGLRVGDVERTIEAAIGGTPISVTIEGRSRFTINVRYPQDLRSDMDKLGRVLVPIGASGADPSLPRLGPPDVMSDAPGMGAAPASSAVGTPAVGARRGFVPLGQLADIKIVGGPPMLRDEDGLLVGYVYVDIDQNQRDIGGYVNEAKESVRRALERGELELPTGYFLKWTGQYEELEEMTARMKILIPVTLMIIVVLLFAYFKSFGEVLIVLLSIPFALVGTVWLVWLLDYRLSTAVWIGVIALAGLAAQTGIVMIVYIDHALEERRRAGKLRNLDDIVAAHMEGSVQRVRPKLMTVGTMLVGLIPLLWATGSGADVMRRIAAPMVGGLVTSAFLTLEIIPVVSTYFRQEQLLWEQLELLDRLRLRRLRIATGVLGVGWFLLLAALVSTLYVSLPAAGFVSALVFALGLTVAGTAWYLLERPAARRQVWPPESTVG
jgi:Cu(I)/Ag(I) efflux system membrane protein CusA/SilA